MVTVISNFFSLFFSLVVTIVLASTGYDLHLRHKREKPDFFVSFSLYTNTKRLWSTHCDNDSLTCLYGIKTISTIWIILGHITIFKGILATNSRTIVSGVIKQQFCYLFYVDVSSGCMTTKILFLSLLHTTWTHFFQLVVFWSFTCI